MALARTRSRSMPAPSSRIVSATSLPSWRARRSILPVSTLPTISRSCSFSMPCATALRSRCSNGAVIFSNTERSSSTPSPSILSTAFLPTSFEVWRTIRCRRSVMLDKGTMRIRIKPCCNSRFKRPCAIKAASASSRFFNSVCCTVATSFTLSAIIRVISCKRVKRSNSSGSNCVSWAADMRDCICDSA